MNKRIRLQRTKGWRLPKNAVSVAFPTKWQNPHRKVRPRSEAARLYRAYLETRPDLVAALNELKGKDLACWCPLDDDCHADVLIELLNEETSS